MRRAWPGAVDVVVAEVDAEPDADADAEEVARVGREFEGEKPPVLWVLVVVDEEATEDEDPVRECGMG